MGEFFIEKQAWLEKQNIWVFKDLCAWIELQLLYACQLRVECPLLRFLDYFLLQGRFQ